MRLREIRHRLLLLTLAAGCAGGDAEKVPTDTGTAQETAAPQPMACTAALAPAVQLVIGVELVAPGAGTVRAVFHDAAAASGEIGAEDRVAPARTVAAGEEIRVELVGNPPESEIAWEVVYEGEAGAHACSGSTVTGAYPAAMPEMIRTVGSDLRQSPEPYVIGAFVGPDGGLAAFRRDGTPVWYYQNPEGGPIDMHYDVGGAGLLLNVYVDNQIGGPDGYIQQISLSGEEIARSAAPYAHHMFTQLPDGTLTFQQLDIRRYALDGEPEQDWVGDAIAEIPPGGEAETVFSVWEVLEPARNDHMNGPGLYPGLDWTHGNQIRYDADADTYLLSLAHAADVLMIDRSTGQTYEIWGTDGMAAAPAFDHQHDPNWLSNGNLLMFMTADDLSGAVEYARDGDALVEVWRHGFEDRSMALGQARRLDNGNTFVNFGSGQQMREVTPDGEILWQIESEDPGVNTPFFGQFYLVNDLYTGQ